jgi:dolichol kinase
MYLRKLVHLSGAAFAIIAWFSPVIAAMGIATGLIVFFTLEAVKLAGAAPWLWSLYREDERAGIAYEPLSYLVAIGSLLLISLFFLPSACYAAIVVLTLGDGIAGLLGRAVGKHPLPYSKKTWEGTAAGFVLAAAAGFLFAGPLAIAGAAAGMAAEAYSRRLENISVALAAFLAMAALSLIP